MFQKEKSFLIKLNNKRAINVRFIELGYSDAMKTNKIIMHAYIEDRLKIYDVIQLIDQEIDLITKCIQENNLDVTKTTFYLVIEAEKGISFVPDLQLVKYVVKTKLKAKDLKGINLGQAVGVFAYKPSKFSKLIPKTLFGFDKGNHYEVTSSLDEAIDYIKRTNFLPSDHDLPDYIKKEIFE